MEYLFSLYVLDILEFGLVETLGMDRNLALNAGREWVTGLTTPCYSIKVRC